MKTLVLTAFFALFMIVSAFGQDRTPRANGRQAAQRGRIVQGRQSGEITKGEAALLNKQQRHIRRTERRAKADGSVTPAERKQLNRKQNRASRNIKRAKNNPIDNN